MRGIAGPTIVWDMEATNMPSMRPTKTSRPCRSRPVKAVSVPGCGAVGAAVLIELLGSLVLGVVGRARDHVRRSRHDGAHRPDETTQCLHWMHYFTECRFCDLSDLPWGRDRRDDPERPDPRAA